MASKLFPALVAAALIIAGCAQTEEVAYSPPEKGDADYMKVKNTRADALYISSDSEPGGRDFRNVYIEPANLSDIRIIQPEGATADEEWAVSDVEDENLGEVGTEELGCEQDSRFRLRREIHGNENEPATLG